MKTGLFSMRAPAHVDALPTPIGLADIDRHVSLFIPAPRLMFAGGVTVQGANA
jgi:hypothetical protein